jgi:aspartyl-tRNA(Asn)/glutamyl-tRNA(Gln) amidotransferase subunit A
VPIAIKDLFDVAGTPTSFGSRAFGRRSADTDATVVARLRAAGAVLVGKTRLAECAYSPGSNNSLFGPTHNPHDPARDTGGSSSGSAAAVAAGLAFAALGSDTGGSIRIPAALCGLVGLKPTFGRVSLAGAMPLSWSLDHAGPLTRTVADAALLLETMAGEDERDPRTRGVAAVRWADPRTLDRGVRGVRIGAVEDDGMTDPAVTPEASEAWRRGLARLAAAGAEVVSIALPMLAPLRILNAPILAAEAAVYHAPTLRARPRDYGDFARARLLAAFAWAPGAYVIAQQARAAWRAALTSRLHGFDMFSTPAMPGPAPPLGIPSSTRFTAAINVLGWPAITVPAGAAGALPLGLQLVARPWEEATLLRAGRALERG